MIRHILEFVIYLYIICTVSTSTGRAPISYSMIDWMLRILPPIVLCCRDVVGLKVGTCVKKGGRGRMENIANDKSEWLSG